MTDYAGEEYQVKSTLTGFNDELLTPDHVDGLTVAIWRSSDAEKVVDDEPMDWDADNEFWYFMWDTTDLAAGTYKAKVVATGIDGGSNWEWKRIRLKADPIPVAP